MLALEASRRFCRAIRVPRASKSGEGKPARARFAALGLRALSWQISLQRSQLNGVDCIDCAINCLPSGKLLRDGRPVNLQQIARRKLYCRERP